MTDSSKITFGHFKPSLSSALLIKLSQKGLGRGAFQHLIFNLWCKIQKKEFVDLIYQGLKLRLDPRTNTIDYKIAFSHKIRESEELDIIKTYTQSHNKTSPIHFLDIGANIGYYALMAAKLGADAILAIEPNPQTAQRLNENIRLNKNETAPITHIPYGVGAKEETLDLTICDTDLGSSSAVNTKISGEITQIKIKPLASILKQHDWTHIDIMKIDIEGMEDKALLPFFEEAPKNQWPKMIFIEDNKDMWEDDILSWLLENGYSVQAKTRSNVVLKQ